jgi:arginine-tRNA-protein transferase
MVSPARAGRSLPPADSSAMTRPLEGPLQYFFGTLSQPCPYLPGRIESKVVTELLATDSQAAHDDLVRAGYRRSHTLAYKPACQGCDACVPVRIPVADFLPSRSLRRVWRRNADLGVSETAARATTEQFALFTRYQRWRHADGGMAVMDFDDYRSMVEETPVDTMVVEFRDPDQRLVAASLTDRVADGLSGVYKFFDPDQRRRSAGSYIVLWHVERARALALPYVYLGYWIADCSKMSYKARFRPIEALGPGGWRRLGGPDKDEHDEAAVTGCAARPSV